MKLAKIKRFAVPAVIAAVAVAFWAWRDSGSGEAQTPGSVRISADGRIPEGGRQAGRRPVRRRPARTVTQVREQVKPVIDLESAEYAELDEMQKELVKAMQVALDADDFAALNDAVARMMQMGRDRAAAAGSTDWSKYVPSVMRRRAVEALGWFGAKSIPELVAFLPDAEPEISAEAQMRLEQALQDYDLGDRELSEIVVSLMRFSNDPDAVDNYYMEISRMRNSVMISTLVEIGQSGTEVAREKLPENLSFYTGDFEIETVEQAEQWLVENPDGEDDDEFYGGAKPD